MFMIWNIHGVDMSEFYADPKKMDKIYLKMCKSRPGLKIIVCKTGRHNR